MGCPSGWPGAALALLLLLLLSLLALCLAALEELEPTTDRQPRTVCTLQEGESRIFTCWVPRPVPGATLAWYLNGQKQELNLSTADTASILTLTGQHSDHQLNCSLTIPTSSETYNTSILLNVQYKPEILWKDAHYQQVESAGLLLVLFVLVQTNPPASTTWMDQDGHVMANTSKLLLLGANHSLHIHLSCTAGNLSISAANSVGIATASLLPTAALSPRSPRAHDCPTRPSPCHPTCASVTLHKKKELPPRMQEPVLGEKKVPCWDWKTPWSSASLVRGASIPKRCVVGHGALWLPQQAMSSLSCRFCPAPKVWAHLQSAQHEQ
ncbi:transmembrane protein 25 isoform X6 [Vidua chalybeata]|uniref:transmembrane protein 25 isoform X6 n=1 Tax=Vidua chalybeata TaxID=81927 RepID=UPI0023A7CD03|nr:transmembrane protein 25 isoform X6 [Vidua chalybeata]